MAHRSATLLLEEQQPLVINGNDQHTLPSPDTVTKLVKRLRALCLRLLPGAVEEDAITDTTGSIVTPTVVKAFMAAGGDFGEAVPLALLRAHALFLREAYQNPADYEENMCRAVACEVIARRIIKRVPHDRLKDVLSTRYRWRQSDGDASAPTCALELAIDQHCTIFLSSNEAQEVVEALWKGKLVQHNNQNDDIDYVEYHNNQEAGSFWYHLDPGRLAVPRYLTQFKIGVWLFYLFVYSKAVSSPLEAVDPLHPFTGWEVTLYIMTFAFAIDEAYKLVKTIRVSPNPWSAFTFWTITSFITEAIILTAFALRLLAMTHEVDDGHRKPLFVTSFRVLACAAPFIWIRLITVFEGYKTVGVLQLVVFRMLRESAIFFILLAIMAVGFAQAMYALDASDGSTGGDGNGDPGTVAGFELLANQLVQSLLGAADFGLVAERFSYPFGLIVFYAWNFVTIIILVNVLIALFGTSYSEVYDNKTDEFLAFFSAKTVGMIRAPDTFVYPAPFNLIETFFIAPFEFCISEKAYIKLNRVVMTIIFFPFLFCIAIYETAVMHGRGLLSDYFAQGVPEDDDDPRILNPEVEDTAGVISTVNFTELEKLLPNTQINSSAIILREIERMRDTLDEIEKQVKDK